MSTRSKGRRNENRTRALLEAEGWLVEQVKGSSKWNASVDFFGLFDIIAVKPNDILWVQVKTNRNASPHDRQLISSFQAPGKKLIYVWYDRQSNPRIHTP